jgi:hypothetical protein
MAGKLVRSGLAAAAAAVAGLTLVGGGLPAQAQARPGIGQGTEVVWDYYNNAQHTTLVGEVARGSCGISSSGQTTAYYTVHEYLCPG